MRNRFHLIPPLKSRSAETSDEWVEWYKDGWLKERSPQTTETLWDAFNAIGFWQDSMGDGECFPWHVLQTEPVLNIWKINNYGDVETLYIVEGEMAAALKRIATTEQSDNAATSTST